MHFEERYLAISYYNSTVIEAILDSVNETRNATGNVDFSLTSNQTYKFTDIVAFLSALKRLENFTDFPELSEIYNSTIIEDLIDAMSDDLINLNNSQMLEIYDKIILKQDNTNTDGYFSTNTSNFVKNISRPRNYNSMSNLNIISNLTNLKKDFYSMNKSLDLTAFEGFLNILNFTNFKELQDIYNSTSIEDLIEAMIYDLNNLKQFPLMVLLGNIYNLTNMDLYFGPATNISHYTGFTRSKVIICPGNLDIDVPWENDPPGECQREIVNLMNFEVG